VNSRSAAGYALFRQQQLDLWYARPAVRARAHMLAHLLRRAETMLGNCIADAFAPDAEA
jgi:hypothetical protein